MVVILRRLLLTGISFVLIFILSGCSDQYYGKRPYDYGFATWICEDPPAWFAVSPDNEVPPRLNGEVILDGQKIRVDFRFIRGLDDVYIDFLDYHVGEGANGYNEALLGHCTFSPEKLVIKVDKDSDRLFNGKYDELVFIRAFTGDEQT